MQYIAKLLKDLEDETQYDEECRKEALEKIEIINRALAEIAKRAAERAKVLLVLKSCFADHKPESQHS